MLLLGRVDVHVVGAGVLADDHALVGVVTGGDEHRAALLQVEQGIGGDDPLTVGHHRAALTGAQLAHPGLVVLEDLVHDALTAGLGQKLGAAADETAGRDDELHAHPAGAVVDHVHHPALAQAHHLGDGAHELLGGVDGDALEGLVQLAVDGLGDDLGLADGELESLTTHLLDEDGQLQLAAALHLPHVRSVGVGHLDGDVADEFLVEAGLEETRGELVTGPTRQRRGVDTDRHRH